MLGFLAEEKRYQREIWIYTEYSGHGKNKGKYKRHLKNLFKR